MILCVIRLDFLFFSFRPFPGSEERIIGEGETRREQSPSINSRLGRLSRRTISKKDRREKKEEREREREQVRTNRETERKSGREERESDAEKCTRQQKTRPTAFFPP